ncbi:gluconate 2-dehydrogenase subunit 3 family protein [Planomicrobium chinense]|uniref:Gluconate 2-dehydrogenase subunit 3 family protein n=1 Tax=Planococcus glaciei TaxID=459472 RepID=A0A7H8QBV3_9BACL|nr:MULTISPECIES: gluconate 2-dehydrogenase subunit 3 family protein [Planococcus]ETP67799.1 dehydrogenase [Planococcus glaciei CHR43]KOF10911.1 dehydrogenase [Planococcus glaciei]MBX0315565.1 gluconate 2-dehydrogenase subunit 3 family protein [Planococcus glaciei]MBZ5200903.1 gluconate 2-dehydrogenase subunit 3 family protein [Planococcus chinensis]QKX50723.1 gluconate 2-dehydrogenase subunit 3 family protein [Planococcus glaciei]
MSKKEKNFSRRDFLKTSGVAAGALVGGGIIGGLIASNTGNETASPGTAPATHGETGSAGGVRGLMFFKNDAEFQILSQATERIFPEDDLGPGAIGLGVPYFIDQQLAGAYGENSKEYMQGPFFEGETTQGYQSRLKRNEMFRQGLQIMQQEAQKRFKANFADLEGGQMDEILTAFQEDQIQMQGVSSLFFFRLLRSATLEGAYADPIYGGNQNMDGWKMKGFPGHQAAYISQIDNEEFQEIDPKSLGTGH